MASSLLQSAMKAVPLSSLKEEMKQMSGDNEKKLQGEENLSVGETESCVEAAEKLRLLMTEKEQLQAEMTERLKRLQADFDNFRRRTRQEKEELAVIITEGVVVQLLPVLDNFERALSVAAGQDAAGLLIGIQMIYKQINGAFEKLGVSAVEAVGAVFDPQQHEAVMRIANPEKEDGIIVEELQKGYILNGKIVRPSMVKVVGNN